MALPESLRLTLILALCVAPGFAQTASYTDDNPSVSPDGKKIAFMSDRDGDIEIYVMNVDGSNPRRLTHSPGRDAHPEWSPDGQKIYFQSPRETKVPQVYVMNADGGEPKRLTNNPGFTGVPLVSPDGKKILYMVNEGPSLEQVHWQIYLMDVDGQESATAIAESGKRSGAAMVA